MTDKEQIMIDGVNVRNCKGIDLSLSPLVKCKSLKFKTSDGGIAGIWCSDHTNCHFKQLQRKTQECEELKKQLMRKDEINTFFNTPIKGWSSNPCGICESKNNYEQLKQECEELKEQLMETKTFDLFADKLIEKFNTDSAIASIFKNNTRYRKALEKIEEVIKSPCAEDCVYYEPSRCYDCIKTSILDIICRAKGEE